MNAIVPGAALMGAQALSACLEYIPGSTISVPGIYKGVPNEAYHRKVDICDGPSISSGGLRTIESVSLAHYFDTSPYNPNREPHKEKEAFIFGRAAHTLLLGEEGFRDEYLIRPDTYPNDPGKAWSGNSNDCKKWLAEAALAGKTVLTKEQIERIRGMAEALAAHPSINPSQGGLQGGLLSGQIERSIFWKDPKTGVWLKARPDCLPLDDNTVSDLKSCDSAHPISVRRSISDWGYHQQLALVDEGIRVTQHRQLTDHVLVFVESKRPHCINIKPVRAEAINDGYRQNRRSIDKFAGAISSGHWPGYDEDDEVPADLTDFLRARLRRDDEEGRLPSLSEVAHAG